jgi:hypothetical protein
MKIVNALKNTSPSNQHFIGWGLICALGGSALWLLTLIATDIIIINSLMGIIFSLLLVVVYALISVIALKLVYAE